MPTVQLTLAADEDLVRRLERLAARQHTTVQLLVTGLLEGAVQAGVDAQDLPPITRSALGMFSGLPNRPYKQLLTDALVGKYGSDK